MSDLHAKPLPDFAKTATIYQIFLRTFTDEGTLRAAEAMIPHLAGLGIDIVYLCPVVEADDDMDKNYWSDRQNKSGFENPKNPYRIKDYFKVDPEYGTDADLKRFVDSCHRFGMRVILDLVYFHCGPKAVFIEKHPDFVVRDESGEVKYGQWHFPMLNFESEGLRQHLLENMEYFIREFDVDGYRCDVSGSVPLDLWEEGRARMEKIKPEVFMLAETNGGIEEQVKAFDSNYGFTQLHGTYELLDKKIDVAELRKRTTDFYERMGDGRFLSGFDSHDIASDHYDKRAEAVCPIEATNAALALCFFRRGFPFIYNGQEVIDKNRHSLWANRDHGSHLHVDWRGACTERGMARMQLVKDLIALRHTHPALAEDTGFEWIDNDQPATAFSFIRKSEEETLVAVLNFSDNPVTVTVSTVLDVHGGDVLISYGASVKKPAASEETEVKVDLLPYGYLLARI